MLIYASNNRKRDNVKIIRIALDLHDVIVDSKIASTNLPSKYWTAKKRSAIYRANTRGAAIVDIVNNFVVEWRFPAEWSSPAQGRQC